MIHKFCINNIFLIGQENTYVNYLINYCSGDIIYHPIDGNSKYSILMFISILQCNMYYNTVLN